LLNDADLWSYDLRGRPPIRLAVAGDDRNPVWSPDGREVVFTVLEGGMANLHRVRADGSMLTPQPLRPERIQALVRAWSSAGELFLVRPPLTSADIVVLPAAATGEMRDLVVTEYAEVDPALSPDGRWLAYASSRTGRPEIWVQGYPDGVAARVSSNGGFEPRWSADGRELFYIQGNALMAVAVQTSGELSFDAPVQLFIGQYAQHSDPAVSSYDVAADGRFLMVQLAGAGGENARASIVVVQNWVEELKRRVPGK
jgi:Tol biopolymer transport system component